LQNVINDFNSAKHEYIEKERSLEEKIARLQIKLKKHMDKYPDVIECLIKPLARAVKERCGFKAFEVYGPFGLENEISVYFANEGEDGNIAICKVETWGLTLHIRCRDNAEVTHLEYWTGETTDEFEKGSIGYLNGMNNVYAKLPTDLDEIIKVLRHSEREG
jgi:hypothetical protein